MKTMLLANIAITILLFLPQFDACAEGLKPNLSLPEHTTSAGFYNKALESFNANDLGASKAFLEHSLYLNPFSSTAHKLNAELFDKLTEKNGAALTESVNELYKFLDFIPALLLFFLLIMSSIYLLLKFTKLVFLERSTFTTQSSHRTHCFWAFSLVTCLFAFYLVKQKSLSMPWACVINSSASLYTGPDDKNFVQIASLDEGSCVEVIKTTQNWVSLQPRSKASGWVKKNEILILRGSKFDPLYNKD